MHTVAPRRTGNYTNKNPLHDGEDFCFHMRLQAESGEDFVHVLEHGFVVEAGFDFFGGEVLSDVFVFAEV